MVALYNYFHNCFVLHLAVSHLATFTLLLQKPAVDTCKDINIPIVHLNFLSHNLDPQSIPSNPPPEDKITK
jgi:hypothetical protein